MITVIFADFSKIDGFALTIAVVGYVVVFLALVLLYFIFNNLQTLLLIDLNRIFSAKRKKKLITGKEERKISGEVNAAIGMSLFLYLNEMHDEESGVITIKKISKRYSPWSSKIYGLRQYPRH